MPKQSTNPDPDIQDGIAFLESIDHLVDRVIEARAALREAQQRYHATLTTLAGALR